MNNLRHIFLLLSLLLLTSALPACSPASGPEDPQPPLREAVIILRTGVAGAANGGVPLSPEEEIRSLRIIIVADEQSTAADGSTVAKGTLEQNRWYSIAGNADGKIFRFPVSLGKKKIYLIANGENITPDGKSQSLHEILSGDDATAAAASLDNLVFIPDYSLPIPLSASYDFEVTEENSNVVQDFYLVRTATKFDISFKNLRSDKVRLKSFSVSSLADKSYLLPQFSGSGDKPTGIFCYQDAAGEELTAPVWHPFIFNDNFTFGESDPVLHWAEWLYKAAAESQTSQNHPTADKRGWIMQYSLPDGASHTEKTWQLSDTEKDAILPEKNLSLSTRYFPESSLPRENAPAGVPEQAYTFSVQFETSDGDPADGNAVWKPSPLFKEQPFSNLRALFRNTHVVLELTLSQFGMSWTVTARPWHQRPQPEIIM